MAFYIHIVVQLHMAISCACISGCIISLCACLSPVVSLSECLSLLECEGLCISVSGDLSKGISLCLSMSLYVSMCYVHIYVSVSVCLWVCGSVDEVHVYPRGVRFNVCLFLCVSVSISMFVSDSGFMSVHVCFGPFHVSVWLCPMGVYVCVCAQMSVSKSTYVRVCVCPWLGPFVGVRISVCGSAYNTYLSLLLLCFFICLTYCLCLSPLPVSAC